MTELATRAGAFLAPQPRPRFAKTTFAIAMVIWVVAMLLWWAMADALSTSSAVSASGPMDVGDSTHVGLAGMVEQQVTVWSISPVTVGPVSVELSLCIRNSDGVTVGTVAGTDELSRFCTSVVPVQRGTVLSPQPPAGDSHDYVVATVTQEGPGQGAFCGLDIVYRSGLRPGWQRQAGSTDFVSNTEDPSAGDSLCPRSP